MDYCGRPCPAGIRGSSGKGTEGDTLAMVTHSFSGWPRFRRTCGLGPRRPRVSALQHRTVLVHAGGWCRLTTCPLSWPAFEPDSFEADTDAPTIPVLYMHGAADILAVGGGVTGHALQLDEDLNEGCSVPSATFGNPRLVSSEGGGFTCAYVEVWGFKYGEDVDSRSQTGVGTPDSPSQAAKGPHDLASTADEIALMSVPTDKTKQN